MPYTDDNLNELFKRAADDYPLNIDNSNWNSIAGKVSKSEAVNIKHSKGSKYAVLLLLLFLGGSFTFYKLWFQSANTELTKNSDLNSDLKEINNSKSNPVPPATLHPSKLNKVVFDPSQQNKNNYTFNSFKTANHTQKTSTSKEESINSSKAFESIKSDPNKISNKTAINLIISQVKEQQIDLENTIDAKSESTLKEDQSILQTDANTKSAKKQTLIKTNPLSYKLYGSLFASPEFSTIKFQHISKPGFKAGVSLGYRINSRFNIELGLQRENMNFYSNGKYFNADNIKLRPETLIENLNGSSKTTSVPIALRYNVSSKNNHQLFVTAGVNALLITHNEKYDYSISKAGSEDALSKKYSSVTDPKYFSGFNVSAGYESKLSNWCNFKVEPYYQAPVRNFGIGELPVSSFGINVGIVKNLK